jgi:hypothetical protein
VVLMALEFLLQENLPNKIKSTRRTSITYWFNQSFIFGFASLGFFILQPKTSPFKLFPRCTGSEETITD